MTDETDDRYALRDVLRRIARYASGMVTHYEHEGFGEARAWRLIANEVATVLDVEPPTAAGDPPARAPTDDELERLIHRCRYVKNDSLGLALSMDEAHSLLERLAGELLLWRRSHPDDLPAAGYH